MSFFGTPQVIIDATPEQPFYIVGRGWSSSSPQSTEKMLQLSCRELSVGDICITLTRNRLSPARQQVKCGVQTKRKSSLSTSGKGPKNPRGSNKSAKGPKATKGAPKRVSIMIDPVSTSDSNMKNSGTTAMLPPPSPLSLKSGTTHLSSTPLSTAVIPKGTTEDPSPKKRRWSPNEEENGIVENNNNNSSEKVIKLENSNYVMSECKTTVGSNV